MTIISILNGDWEILLDDEKNMSGGTGAVAGMRTIRKAVATPTIVTTRTLYSAVADAMDDFVAMGFRNAMLPTTPNAFTLENKYFIPRSSIEFLKEGAITANWTASGSREGDGVLKITYSGGTAFVSTDIGRQVVKSGGTDAGDSGTLLDYDQDPDGTLVAWIRPDDPSTDLFDDGTTGSLSTVADGGTGNPNVSAAAISGSTQWSAIQAIGSVPTATEVYLYQDRTKITNSTGGFQWWTTDTDASLGIISVLIQVQNSGVLIADGDVEVFARRYTALYDNFRLNVSAGGFSALPLASAPDINNTTGYRTFTGSSGSGTFTVGNAIYVGATYAAATKKGVITAVGGTGAAPVIEYYLVGDLTDFANLDAVKEYDFEAAADGDATCTAGTPGANSGGPTDSASGEGGTVTVSLGGFLVDHTGDGTTEPYSIQVDCQGNVPIAKVYERIKYITRRGATTSDLFGAGVNVPGEAYRGLDGIFEYDANTSAMTEGDDVATTTGGNTWTARLINQNTTNSPTYITVTDQQTSLDSVIDNNVIFDEAGLGVQDVTVHAGGTIGLETFTSPKSSPFGTFTGTQIFGARGVAFINPNTGDEQAYILTDDLGTLNNPPNTVSFTVTNTAALDRILVARDTGTAGIINKDQFGGLATPAGAYNGIGDGIIRVAGSIDAEVPQSGYVRVVENTKLEEHKYEYSSRTTGASGEFTLTTASSYTGAASATDTTGPVYTLTSSGKTFQTQGVKPGMLIRNTTTGEFFEVVNVTSETTIDTVEIHGAGGSGWTNLDNYEINKLIQNYATTDDVYDLILDVEATGSSVNNTFTKTLAANFGVVVNVRQGKIILPFTLNQTQGDGSTTVTVVRQPDTIAV